MKVLKILCTYLAGKNGAIFGGTSIANVIIFEIMENPFNA